VCPLPKVSLWYNSISVAFSGAVTVLQAQWCNDKYSIQMLCAPSQAFLLAWRDTDSLFARMPDWGEAPIDLRHPFGFYYGHVCSFTKLRLLPVSPPPPGV